MKKDKKPVTATLLKEAEKQLKPKPSADDLLYSESDMLKLIHELQVRKLELEIQNEELRLAGMELKKLSKVIEQSPVMIYLTDLQGSIEYTNPKTIALTGYTREELVGNNPRLLSSGEKTKEEYRILWETIQMGHEWRGEFHDKKKNGELFWLAASISPIFDSGGKITHYLAVQEDITERKTAEESLRDSEQRYRAIFEGSADGIMIADEETKTILFANSAQCNMLGYTEAQLKTMNISEIHPVETFQDTLAAFGRLARREINLAENIQCVKKNGEIFYADVNSHFVNINGRIGIVGFFRDITERKLVQQKIQDLNATLEFKVGDRTLELKKVNEKLEKDVEDRKRTEEELRWNQMLLNMMADSSPLGFLVVDNRTDNILYFNQRFCQIWGITHISGQMERGELKNNDIIPYCLTVLADIPAYAESCKPLRDEANRIVIEDEIAFTQGRTVRRFSTQIRGANDQYYGRFYIFEEITERKQAEEKIIKSRDEAHKANLTKSEFLSRMSHELRTPMNSILGFAQLMDMGELTPRQKTGIGHILNSGKHLLKLIDEVLDISRIDSGRLLLMVEPVLLNDFIPEILDSIQPLAHVRQLKLELENSPGDQLYVMSDRTRLQQVLINLLNNAVKYNRPGGSIRVKTETIPQNDNGISSVRISVKDTGLGISSDDITKLFVPFERIGAEKTQVEGTGLGLSVVKRIMEAMEGKVGVESIFGEGSTFWIELPITENQISWKKQKENNEKLSDELVNSNKKLVIQNGEKAERASELVIANIELAYQNVEKAKRAAELVIANKELVYQNGEKAKRAAELVIAIKELAYQNGEKAKRAAELVIANKELAYQNEEKAKRSSELEFLKKSHSIQNEDAFKTGNHVTEKTGTILYIEDNIPNLELVEEILAKHLPEKQLVASIFGEHANELAIAYKPDLILLDLDLPDIQGIEVLANLRADEKTKSIPVVIITADATTTQIEKLMTAGASDYLTKPLDIIMFLQVVDEWTGSGKQFKNQTL